MCMEILNTFKRMIIIAFATTFIIITAVPKHQFQFYIHLIK